MVVTLMHYKPPFLNSCSEELGEELDIWSTRLLKGHKPTAVPNDWKNIKVFRRESTAHFVLVVSLINSENKLWIFHLLLLYVHLSYPIPVPWVNY